MGFLEPSTGIEPVAFSLPRKCSTTELRRHLRAGFGYSVGSCDPYHEVRRACDCDQIWLCPTDARTLAILGRSNAQGAAARRGVLRRYTLTDYRHLLIAGASGNLSLRASRG
jgi:hypothetical protein